MKRSIRFKVNDGEWTLLRADSSRESADTVVSAVAKMMCSIPIDSVIVTAKNGTTIHFVDDPDFTEKS